ncbi:MAG: DUF2993 domain-containing protein [Abditibacteriales bacterium]|nr:DUF2993 domain-containing protein [Abditibacteriales bacterium]MDW8364964.1 DUF2993 domain-containing protein [Abditibacteriales bacterium]
MKTVVGALLGGLLLTHLLITPRMLARKIKGFLRQRVPGVQELQVEVRGPRGLRALKGKFDALVIRGRGSDVTPLAEELLVAMKRVRYKNGIGHIKEVTAWASQFTYRDIAVEQASVVLHNVTFNAEQMVKRRKVSDLAFERATATVSLAPSTAEKLGLAVLQKKGVRDATLRLCQGYVEVTGKRRLPFGADATVTVTGKVVGKGNTLHITDVQMTTGGKALPASLVEPLMEDMNPLVVFDEDQSLPFSINFRSVTITPERITAEGELIYRSAVNGGR